MLQFGQPEVDQALDAFLGECLFRAGVWSSPRGGDGIAHVRVVERTGVRVRLLGWIWLVESQTQEAFWIDLRRDVDASDRVDWMLYFGLLSFAPVRLRDVRDAVELMSAPEEGAWRVQLTGKAVLTNGEIQAIEVTPAV